MFFELSLQTVELIVAQYSSYYLNANHEQCGHNAARPVKNRVPRADFSLNLLAVKLAVKRYKPLITLSAII